MMPSSILRESRSLWARLCGLRFGGPDLAARLALLVFGVAAMTAARTLTFIAVVPDRNIPPIRPLLWVFHQADLLFLPGLNRLPTLASIQDVQFVALALALLCFYFAARSTVPAFLRRHNRPLAYSALVLAGLLQILTLQGILPYPLALGTRHYGNDAVTVTSCASDAFLQNKNPYATFRMIDCMNKNGMLYFKTTPLQAGAFKQYKLYPPASALERQYAAAVAQHQQYPPEFEAYYSYPAVSFLMPALAVALHLHDLSVLYLLCYLGIVALVIWRARAPAARRIAVIVAAANAALWPTIVSGATDALYALLVLVAWATRDRRWLSAVVLGLAVASRQQAWFFLLFYAILIWRTAGRRELAWRLGIVAGVFALTNLPYLIASPGPWLAGVFGPMRDPMFPRGSGLIALSTAGVGSLPLGPRALYTVLEVLGLAGSAAFYWRTCRAHPGTGLVLAPVALFFAWRSLYSYFLPLSLLALYPALLEYTRPREFDTIDDATASPTDEVAA